VTVTSSQIASYVCPDMNLGMLGARQDVVWVQKWQCATEQLLSASVRLIETVTSTIVNVDYYVHYCVWSLWYW